MVPNRRSPIWHIQIHDSPEDPDWAAWCVLQDLEDIVLPPDDIMRMSKGNVLKISGLVI